MDNRDTLCCVNMSDAGSSEEDITVGGVVKMALECRAQLENEIKHLNRLLESKRKELDRLNDVINFKHIDNRRP